MKNEKQHPIAHLMLKACQKVENSADYKVSDIEFSLVPVGESAYVCAIRSTEFFPLSKGNWRDTVRNLTVIPWYDKRVGWCHLGYLLAAKKVVKEAMKKEECVTAFTGFSMGGAIALLAAELYEYETSSKYHTGTIVFGAPNPTYTKPHKTWVNYRLKNDIVGSWPPLGSKKARKNIGVGNLSGSYNDLKGRFKTHNLQQYINYFKIRE